MNIQKLYEALERDDQNSALGIITGELESQGYRVEIDSVPVEAEGFFEGKYSDLENKTDALDFSLFRDGKLEQEFCLEFVEFHDFIIKRKEN